MPRASGLWKKTLGQIKPTTTMGLREVPGVRDA